MKFVLLDSVNDMDMPKIQSVYTHSSISRFICINTDNYWHYVTATENVYFYKVYDRNNLISTVHCELYDKVLHLALVVFPEHQRMGLGATILKAIQKGDLDLSFDKIHASIELQNFASRRLFEKSGFDCIAKGNDLLEYEYRMD